MKIALDRQALRSALNEDAPQHDLLVQIIHLVDVCILPLVAAEIGTDGDDAERRWRDAGFKAIEADDFLKGCAAGMAKRYVDYHPDPRDCRLVAEAECAKLDLVVTLNENLVHGLADRAENVRIMMPFDALRQLRNASHDRAQD